MINHRRWLWITLILISVAAITIACASATATRTIQPPIIEPRGIYPTGTPTPVGHVAGLVVVRDFSDPLATPIVGQVGSHWQIYWDQVQPNMSVTPNWNSASTRVAAVATAGMKTFLSVAFYEINACGSLDYQYYPTDVPRVSYAQGSCGTDYAPNYASKTFQDAYDTMVQSLLTQFGADSNVGGFILEFGADGEAVNTKELSSGARANLEAVVPCSAYQSAITRAMQTWRKYTNKPIFINTGLGRCSSEANWRASLSILETSVPSTPRYPTIEPYATPTLTPIYIGYKNNSAAADRPDAWQYEKTSPWGKIQAGARQDQIGGAAFEPGLFPSAYATQDREGFARMMSLSALGPGHADNLFYQVDWLPLLTASTKYIITQTAGTTAGNSPIAWIGFYDTLFQRQGSYDYSLSGVPGPYGHLARLSYQQAQPTRVCAPNPKATVAAQSFTGYQTPAPCTVAMSTPAAAESYYNFAYAANTIIGIDLDDTWANRFGASNTLTAKVTYLNSGTDTWTLTWQTNTGSSATNVTKTNTGAWVTTALLLTNAKFRNGLSNSSDILINTNSGAENFNFISVEIGDTTTSPTVTVVIPTITPTSSHTPTRTQTPTKTPTWSVTPSPTPVNTAVGDTGLMSSVTISRLRPDTNYNTAETNGTSWAQRAIDNVILIKWNTLAKPANATGVITASLTLNTVMWGYYDAGRTTPFIPMQIVEMARAWSADNVTWNYDGVSDYWEVAGAAGSSDIRLDGPTYSRTLYRYTIIEPQTFDVTQSVKRWLDDGVATNYGWRIALTDPYCADLNCTVSWSIASDRWWDLSLRPELTITYAYATTVTPTPTPSPTATLPPTPTNTTTPPSTATFTPTPVLPTATPLPGIKINELCIDPTVDYNLDGWINTDDRFIEIYNPGTAITKFVQYRLVFNDGANVYTWIAPRNTQISNNGYKVLLGEDAVTYLGKSFVIPSSGTVTLRDADGTYLDSLRYNWQGAGLCWARIPNGNLPWSSSAQPSIGTVNQ